MTVSYPSVGFDWSDLDPTYKDSAIRKGFRAADPTNPGSTVGEALRGGPNHFNIYVKNGTSAPIQVHVVWQVRADSGGACVAQVGVKCDDSDWNTNSYWTVQPGQKAFLIDDANGSIAYFSAKSLDNTGEWTKKKVDMGSKYGDFTYTFSE